MIYKVMVFPEILVDSAPTPFYLWVFSIDSKALSNKEKVGMRLEVENEVTLI